MANTHTNGYVNLDYVVNLVLMDLEDHTSSMRKKALQLGVLGFTDLNIYIMENIRVSYLSQNDNFTFDLPTDFIDYIKIGFVQENTVITLTLNEDLPFPDRSKMKVCDDSSDPNTLAAAGQVYTFPNYGHYFPSHYRNGQYVGEMFGIGGGININYFRVDKERRQIVLDKAIPGSEIILEYKSSGIKKDGSTVVPREVVQALRAYIHWQLLEYNDRVPLSTKERRKKLYYVEYDKLNFFTNSFTLSEYLDSKYKASTQTIKR